MDFARVEGYLRSACSVLDFDVGELWQAEKIQGNISAAKNSPPQLSWGTQCNNYDDGITNSASNRRHRSWPYIEFRPDLHITSL